ncbi:MAG TPA: hypothetical protein VMU22_03990 [Rhizomicrobium sp.]|nr:hypothetical protein [Rhizomicrobium sp.]
MSNVVRLPRPQKDRERAAPLGLYLRVGRDQHKDLLDVLAQGEMDFFGLVIDARYTQRHRELKTEALRRQLDVVLDPNTHAMATVGGHTAAAASLPWGLSRPHRADDFAGAAGRERAKKIAQFVVENGFTQLLGPTHLLSSANDLWLRRDIEVMGWVHHELRQLSPTMPLIYPLAIPVQVFRDAAQRQAIIAAIADAPNDALWLRIENFGQDATGEKLAAYIEACADFRELGKPLVADYAGGLAGLGLLAFGAVGGLAHGITLFESFKPGGWRRPKPESEQAGGVSTRVYIQQLDMLLKPKDARAFLESSTRVRTQFGCRNTHCCPGGIKDQVDNPTRHYVHTRSEQISKLSATPLALRVNRYMDDYVRPISDSVAAVSDFPSISPDLKNVIKRRNKMAGRFRQAMSHFAQIYRTPEPLDPPLSRPARETQHKK